LARNPVVERRMYGGGVSHWSNLRCCNFSIHMIRNLLLLPLMPDLLSCGVRDGQAGRKSEHTLLSEADPPFRGMYALPIQAGQAFFWITPLLYNTDSRLEG